MFGGFSPGDLAPLVVLLAAMLLLFPRFRRARGADRAGRAARFIMLTLALALAATFIMRWLGL